MTGREWVLLAVALIMGVAITYVDSRPTWDDTGITAAAVGGTCAVLGFLAPRRAWLWALAVGAGIPILALLLHHNVASLLALAIAVLGAALGAGIRIASIRATA